MSLASLPPELRYKIYTDWFTDRIYKPTSPVFVSPRRYGLPGDKWLSDAFVICKALTSDPWLTRAILEHTTFHIDDERDLSDLRRRFGDDALTIFTRISLGPGMLGNGKIALLRELMPNLKQVHVSGSVTYMWRIWSLRLADLQENEWAKYIACLCVFAPVGVLGKSEAWMELVLSEEIELVVRFTWSEANFGMRSMTMSTRDWLLRYQCGGKAYEMKQVRPRDLQAALEEKM